METFKKYPSLVRQRSKIFLPFTVSGIQVPPLHLITMSPYMTFKGMASGRLTVSGDMLLTAQMLAPKWLIHWPLSSPDSGVRGFLL